MRQRCRQHPHECGQAHRVQRYAAHHQRTVCRPPVAFTSCTLTLTVAPGPGLSLQLGEGINKFYQVRLRTGTHAHAHAHVAPR